VRTSDEIYRDKNLLKNMDCLDVYDIAYTHGSESISKEKFEPTVNNVN
jgi:hypothetical protein